jgi:glucose-6-phosphate isomerase
METAVLTALASLEAHKDAVLATSISGEFARDPDRFQRFHVVLDDLLFDFSKQRVEALTIGLLVALAQAAEVEAKRESMFRGDIVNPTERRAALHTALRDLTSQPVFVDGRDVAPDIAAERAKMLAFAEDVREGRVRGALGQPMTDVVNIGIGGSDLGPAMAARALSPYAPLLLHAHFVSNVDGADIADTLRGLDPARTLFIVSSKTFTTQETMTNARSAREWISATLGAEAVSDHFAAVSTRLDKVAEFGIQAGRVFGFWDWVGGRYSIWSSIGLPLAIAIGPVEFEEFLRGGSEVDRHFREAPIDRNIPMLMGLLSVWNRNILGHACHAVIPYDQRMARFPAYLQQLQMESNGKSVQLERIEGGHGHGPRRLGRARHQRAACVLPAAASGYRNRPDRFPRRREADRRRRSPSSRTAARQYAGPGRGADAGPHAGGSRTSDRRPGRKPIGGRSACAAQVVLRQPAVVDLPLLANDAAGVGPPNRALRAQGVRGGGRLEHQPVRPMGRRTRQGTHLAPRPDRCGRGRGHFRAGSIDRGADRSFTDAAELAA